MEWEITELKALFVMWVGWLHCHAICSKWNQFCWLWRHRIGNHWQLIYGQRK